MSLLNQREIELELSKLMSIPTETESVEFKAAVESFSFEKLGQYFSALSNEANLKGTSCAWLILGVSDRPPRQVVGTNYKKDRHSLESLKREIAEHTSHHLTFEEIYELNHIGDKRVLMFQILPAMRGIPVAWQGHYYGRDGDALVPLNLCELEQIRKQVVREDWSAMICKGATLADLDPEAVRFARAQFKLKNRGLESEVDSWETTTFLNKAKICNNGLITNTALILLGRKEASHFISPGVSSITWILRDSSGIEKDYEHYSAPLILAVDKVYSRIRNLTYRHMPDQRLFPTEVSQYDPWVIRETLHNCIAHQDYSKAGRINIVENPDSLVFTNLGQFLPGSVDKVIYNDAPSEYYRNSFLVNAMVNLNMIDTIGSGIKRMFNVQRQRFFPMPDYDLRDTDRVQVRVFGKVLDENYTRILVESQDLNLMDVIALDKVQKKQPLTDDEFKRLKTQKLIEGRRPNLFVSAKIAAVTGHKADYIKHKAFDKEHYKKLIVSYLEKFRVAKRSDLEELLFDKLSDALSPEQKTNRIKNIIQDMRRENIITTTGAGKKWRLVNG